MRALPLLSALVLAPFVLNAQRAGSPAVLQAQDASQACPVDASATRQGSGSVMATDNDGAGPREAIVSLELRPRKAHRILGATVVVHALSLKARTLPVTGAVPDITREFHLQAGPNKKPEFTSRLSLDRPATVLWLDITELRYIDGSSWTAGEDAGCRVEPDKVVLVAALP